MVQKAKRKTKSTAKTKSAAKKPPTKAEIERAEKKYVYLLKEQRRLILHRDALRKEIREETSWLNDLKHSHELTERQITETSAELKKYAAELRKRGITGEMIGAFL